MSEKTLEQKVRQAVLEIDSILSADGTRVELLEITFDGKVRLKLKGDCPTCGERVMMTLKAGIEAMLKEQVPEIREITIS